MTDFNLALPYLPWIAKINESLNRTSSEIDENSVDLKWNQWVFSIDMSPGSFQFQKNRLDSLHFKWSQLTLFDLNHWPILAQLTWSVENSYLLKGTALQIEQNRTELTSSVIRVWLQLRSPLSSLKCLKYWLAHMWLNWNWWELSRPEVRLVSAFSLKFY